MKRTFYILIIWLHFAKWGSSQTADSNNPFIRLNHVTIENALDAVSKQYHLNFSYQSNLPDLQRKKSVMVSKLILAEALDSVLNNTSLSYKIFANQVVIFPSKTASPRKIVLEGKLCKYGSSDPISFAGVELITAHKGTISDLQGYFRIELENKFISDTFLVASMNYAPLKIPVRHLMNSGMHTFYMTERVYTIPDIEIKGLKQHLETWGNHRWISSGSFYLDTHGQQTALFIKNEKRCVGNLISSSFYLSKKGNTDAPFRVHVYRPDSITGKPGEEMLPEMIVIKPGSGKGWYKVNLSKYRITLPSTGIYIAIEGIFPGDYDAYYTDESMNSSNNENEPPDEFEGETISYGQQIGYSGGSENNTWHYSIDRTWFQLKKKRFNAMISAEIKITKNKNERHFFGLFAFKKDKY
jgi:hypothetical protein